ncbi:MAG: Ig-like domain-containing protein [Longimicrobiales bacterium]
MRPDRIVRLIPLFFLFALVSCSESLSEPEPPQATEIALDQSTLEVDDGASSQLEATVIDQYGEPMSGIDVSWTSADPGIATVEGGVVTGVYPGETIVTAAAGDLSSSADVVVIRVPTDLQLVGGTDQAGVVGEPLADSIRVLLLDRHSEPVPGASVVFEVAAGEGSVGPDTAVAASDGSAATSWILGTGVGEHALDVTCPRLPSEVQQVTALAVAAPAARMVLVEGAGQTGTVAEPLADSVAVQVFDAYDNPVHGAVVAWDPEDPTAAFRPSVSTAAADGVARAKWVLGFVAGEQTAQAVIGGLETVVFAADAGPGAPNELVITRGSDQTLPVGTVADTLEVKAVDRWGNAIGGVAVDWVPDPMSGAVAVVSGVGDVTHSADGTAAAVWTLGSTRGEQIVRARAASIPEAIFRATGVSVPDTMIVAGENGWRDVPMLTEVPDPLRVLVEDEYGNPVEGAKVEWDVSAGTGSVDPTVVRTGADGVASTRWTLGYTGSDTVTASTGKLEAGFVARARPLVAVLEIDDTTVTALRDTTDLGLRGWDILGDPVTEPSTLGLVDWSSSDPAVASLLWDGRVVSRANGTATITVELDDGVGQATVTVRQEADSIDAGLGTARLRVRERQPLLFTLYDANGFEMEPVATTYSSSFPAVASVIGGPLLAADYPGEATIEIAHGSASATVDVTVVPGEAITAGQSHTCALAPSGQAYCWGRNDRGQVGDGSFADAITPVSVTGGHRFRQLAAGYEFTCGVTFQNRVYCWGANDLAQLGDGTYTDSNSPVHVMSRATAVSGGYGHACALTDIGSTYCWGSNRYGKLGQGVATGDTVPTPVEVTGGQRFVQLAAGGFHTCGLRADGQAFCWGSNVSGQIGDATNYVRPVPTPVAGDLVFNGITAGYSHTCATTSYDNLARVWCWGENGSYQLGDGTYDDRNYPVPVGQGIDFVMVDGGRYSTCAITDSDDVYCWGYNADGQLGVDDTSGRMSPTTVVGGSGLTWITAGGYHTCAVGPDDAAYCWGSNEYGQLGVGELMEALTPAPIMVPMGVIFARLPLEWIFPGGAPPGTDGVAGD